MSDPCVAVLVEIRELKRQLTTLECVVRDFMEERGREECATHGLAPPAHVAPFCSEAMDGLEGDS